MCHCAPRFTKTPTVASTSALIIEQAPTATGNDHDHNGPDMSSICRERSVTHDGGRLYVRDYPGLSPAIVALHGFPDDSHIYNRMIGRLAPQRVVAFDWVGYGRSTRRDSKQFSAPDRQRELLAVLDGLELEQVVLVGRDAGGPEAIDFTVTSPVRVAQLVQLNTYYGRTARHFGAGIGDLRPQ